MDKIDQNAKSESWASADGKITGLIVKAPDGNVAFLTDAVALDAMRRVKIAIKKHPNGRDLPLPKYETSASAGMDLRAAFPNAKTAYLEPGDIRLIPCGFSIAIPQGYEGQVRARSGLAKNHGICMANGVGTIDSDYRGEMGVLLYNAGKETYKIERGARIAQLVIAPIVQAEWDELPEGSVLPETTRGEGGFGSTGS